MQGTMDKQKQVTKYEDTYPLARRPGTRRELHAAFSSFWMSGSGC